MDELLKHPEYSEIFSKGFLWMVAVISLGGLLLAGGIAIRALTKYAIKYLDTTKDAIKGMSDLFNKMDTRIQLQEQDMKFQKTRIDKHDVQMDLMMKHLLDATKK